MPLPKGWPKVVRAGVLHAVALAHAALVIVRGAAAERGDRLTRLAAKLVAAEEEISVLREELRIKDARLARLEPRRRPYYPAIERLAILSLRAARGWSIAETARRFLVEAKTVASWMGRLDEDGEGALVRNVAPVNRFPDFVAQIVRHLKAVCPAMGKKRIAQVLARAGLHLGVTTVRRMLKRKASPPSPPRSSTANAAQAPIRARHLHHVWQTDLTLVPTAAGFWVPWVPFAKLPRWPFAWWLAVVVDTFSRKVVGFRLFKDPPSAVDICALLRDCVESAELPPKYLVSDKGSQFVADAYREWCRKKGILTRYAAADSLRATAIVERFFRSLKTEWLHRVRIPLGLEEISGTVQLYLDWYHVHRPHQGLGGRTPNEVAHGLLPANHTARFEPRQRWPARSACALPKTRTRRGGKGCVLVAAVASVDRHTMLPVLSLDRAA